jgi:predicted aminopeptidase
MLRIIKRSLLALLVIVVAMILLNWSLVSYAVQQAYGQLRIVWNAKPVEELMLDPNFPDSLKVKLQYIQEVRKYAIDSLGLKDTRNYKTVFNQEGKEIMWVVTASEPFQLKAKAWSFPILGAVPYKGFFDEEKAVALADELKREGWDVNVRNPAGWSTLGWFTDPILSKMLERNEGDLASLIIHEMAHATIFVKDSIDFNENLASFIGDRGAENFLIAHFGRTSAEYTTYMKEDTDYVKYVDHVLHATVVLDSLYSTMSDHDPISQKQMQKEMMIRRIVDTMDTLTLAIRKPSRKFKKELPNNAYFMSFIHYQSGQDELWKEWKEKFDSDLKAYILFLSERYPFL